MFTADEKLQKILEERNELSTEIDRLKKEAEENGLPLHEVYNKNMRLVLRYVELNEAVQFYLQSKNKQSKNEKRNFVKKNREKILEYQGSECYVCKLDHAPMLEIHHILPLKDGGDNSLDNLVPLCPNCHRLAHISKDKNKNSDTQNWMLENLSVKAYSRLCEVSR